MIDSSVPPLDMQSNAGSPQPEQMAEVSAESLMDDLFDPVEKALEGDLDALEALSKAPSAIADQPKESAVSELTLNFTEGGLPPVLVAPATPVSNGLTTDSVANFVNPLATVPSSSEAAGNDTADTEAPSWKRFWTLNRALLGAAGLTLLATLGLWMHQRQQAEVVSSATTTVPEVVAVNPHAEFLEYLRRSLDVIAQNTPAADSTTATTAPDVAVALNNGTDVTLPSMSNNMLPPTTNGLPTEPGSVNVIERVYVPYPSAQAPAGVATAPNAPINPGAISGNSAAAPASAQSHTLLGVLELGDRSAALFEIEGTPQRVYIGERIGNSGWSLVSVANEEAVIRRNGEVRTLYIGQQF